MSDANARQRPDGDAALLDPSDRAYVASLGPSSQRDAVVASLARYRAADTLQPGDHLPAVRVRRADTLEQLKLASLVGSRPLLLIFGSFT